jgi:hypothetical protein
VTVIVVLKTLTVEVAATSEIPIWVRHIQICVELWDYLPLVMVVVADSTGVIEVVVVRVAGKGAMNETV